ncbi:MAG TPA: DNA repair protein RecN [Devosia sp.]|nr:DNA repair protein RecN [Devosia sp.]
MLSALSVNNIVLIDRLDLTLEAGLSVLTGETGAGKSILLDALTLALGGRGDQTLVRKGCDSGQVIAVFRLPLEHGVRRLLRKNDVADEDELILRRVQFADGRTRALINDQPVSAALLREIGSLLVEIHGQHDERALVDSAIHRRLLDEFGGHMEVVEKVNGACLALKGAEEELAEQEKNIALARKEEEFARHVVEELSQLAPREGEEEQLALRRRHLMQLEKAADEVRDADEILSGPAAPASALATLLRRLQRKAGGEDDLFLPLIEGLDASLEALERTGETLETIKREMDFDPDELNEVEERLFALRGMARKHSVAPDALGGVLAHYQGALQDLQDGAAELERLKEARDMARRDYDEAATELSSRRSRAAEALETAVEAELPDLKLGAARFIVDRGEDTARVSPDGYDQISFHVQTNPGTRAGPMLKVASGGELSRFLLALKVVLAERGSAPVLIFDEIDTGVGGAVADAMGRRLARLAKQVQVLAVTHAPQVAARAKTHMLIEKQAVEAGAHMRTQVRELDQTERGEEIARMLAGAEVSEEARAAARRLISEVG